MTLHARTFAMRQAYLFVNGVAVDLKGLKLALHDGEESLLLLQLHLLVNLAAP